MTDTNKCKKFDHEFLYNDSSHLGRKRICFKCGFKQIQKWLPDCSEEM